MTHLRLKHPTDSTERQIQRTVVQYIRAKYPGVIVFAIPNGGSRNKIEAANLKKDGVLAGVPDLFVAKPMTDWCDHFVETCASYAGLFIELKSKRGRLSVQQLKVINDLRVCGYKAEVCYSADEAMKVVDEYLG